MDLPAHFSAFLHHCHSGRNLSENTIKAYGQDLAELKRYLAEPRRESPTTPAGLVSYSQWLSDCRRLAPATVKRRLACLRALLGWAERRGLIVTSPFRTVPFHGIGTPLRG
jgi:integrase/recombinase XerD